MPSFDTILQSLPEEAMKESVEIEVDEIKETTQHIPSPTTAPTPTPTPTPTTTTTPQSTTISSPKGLVQQVLTTSSFPINSSSGFEKAFKTQILRPLTNNENFTIPLINLRPIFQTMLLSTTATTTTATTSQQQQQPKEKQQQQQLYEEGIIDLLRHKYIPQVIQYILNYNGNNDEEIIWISHTLQTFMEVSVIWMREHGLDYLGGDWWDALYKCIGDGFYDDIVVENNSVYTSGVGGNRKNSILPRYDLFLKFRICNIYLLFTFIYSF